MAVEQDIQEKAHRQFLRGRRRGATSTQTRSTNQVLSASPIDDPEYTQRTFGGGMGMGAAKRQMMEMEGVSSSSANDVAPKKSKFLQGSSARAIQSLDKALKAQRARR